MASRKFVHLSWFVPLLLLANGDQASGLGLDSVTRWLDGRIEAHRERRELRLRACRSAAEAEAERIRRLPGVSSVRFTRDYSSAAELHVVLEFVREQQRCGFNVYSREKSEPCQIYKVISFCEPASR